jgi:hypothetical protein
MSGIIGRLLERFRAPAMLLAVTATLGGCAASGVQTASYAPGTGAGVAFDSIDGPPPQVFDRMVRALDAEALARNVPVVSREAAATYRVRSYLSAQVRRGNVTIAWVWDVYDRNQQRALRLSGEEPAGRAGRDAWAAADDAVLRKIAQAGVAGLAGLTSGQDPAATPDPSSPVAPRGPTVAFADGLSSSRLGFGVE